MQIKAISIREFDFAPYGVYYDLLHDEKLVSHSKTENYEDHLTRTPLIDTPAQLGYTIGSAAPYTVLSMERHDHTQEAIFCMSDTIVLCVACSTSEASPRAQDIRAVLLEPGDVVVMERNVWHDACHGKNASAGYYYAATSGKQPAVWAVPTGGEAEIAL